MLSSLRALITGNYYFKKAFYWLLRSPLFTHNGLYRHLYLKNVQRKIRVWKDRPLCVQIENTNFCNLSCVFCPNETMRRKRGFIEEGLYRTIIDQCARWDIPTVIITGFGEPLLDINYISRIAYAKKKGLRNVQCVTNGTLLSEDIAKGLFDAGLDYLFLSIDAVTPQTYGRIHRVFKQGVPFAKFDILMKNIDTIIALKKKYNRAKPIIEIRFKDFKVNKGELSVFIKKYRDRVDRVNIYMNIFHWPGSDIRMTIPTNHLLRFPCYSLWTNLYVAFNGVVPLCCQDYECRHELGDVARDTLLDIWDGQKLRKARDLHLQGRYEENIICSDCLINSHLVTPWWE